MDLSSILNKSVTFGACETVLLTLWHLFQGHAKSQNIWIISLPCLSPRRAPRETVYSVETPDRWAPKYLSAFARRAREHFVRLLVEIMGLEKKL